MQPQADATDVLVVGGGIAGLLAALALRKALPADRTVTVLEPAKLGERDDYKVGEALIEWSVAAMSKLGLFEYLDEDHPDKFGLSFHMRKGDGAASTYGEYYHLWGDEFLSSGGGLVLHFPRSFFIDRVKFESRVSALAQERGVRFIQGAAADVRLADAGSAQPHTVLYHPASRASRAPPVDAAGAGAEAEANGAGRPHEIRCRWVVDCAGRRFFVARKTGILQRQIAEVNTGAAWVRVRGFDTSILQTFGCQPHAQSQDLRQIRFLSTSHWIGRGHWLWTIPLREEPEFLSVGVIYHYEHHPGPMDTEEQFLTWLEGQHAWLARLIRSGTIVDFQSRHRLAYRVSRFVDAERRWAVCGDAAVFMDAMYSQGIALSATAAELAAAVAAEDFGNRPQRALEVAKSGNEVLGAIVDCVEAQFNAHRHILHDPQAFSIVNCNFYDAYIGGILPAYLSGAHTTPEVARLALPILRRRAASWKPVNAIARTVAKRNAQRPPKNPAIYELHGTNLGLYFQNYAHPRGPRGNYSGITPMPVADAVKSMWYCDRIGRFLVGELSARHGGVLAVLRNFRLSWMYLLGVLTGLCALTRWFVARLPHPLLLLGRRWALKPGTVVLSAAPGTVNVQYLPLQPGMSSPQYGCGRGLRIDPTKLCFIPTNQPLQPPTDGNAI